MQGITQTVGPLVLSLGILFAAVYSLAEHSNGKGIVSDSGMVPHNQADSRMLVPRTGKTLSVNGNRVCPVTGQPIDPEVYVDYRDVRQNVAGRVYLCCENCKDEASEDLSQTYGKAYRVDQKTGRSNAPIDLKNTVCPIMLRKPAIPEVSTEYNGVIVHFHCEGCIPPFLNDPDLALRRAKADQIRNRSLHSRRQRGLQPPKRETWWPWDDRQQQTWL